LYAFFVFYAETLKIRIMSTYESLLDSAVGSAMAKVQSVSTDELKALLNDDDKLSELIKDMPQAKHIATEKEMLLAQNKSIAQWNLSQEPKLRDAKAHLLDVFEQAEKLKAEAEEKRDQLNALTNQRSLDTTLALLQTAAAQAEEESEKIAEAFVNGETPADIFLVEFKAKRQLAHMRKLKAEKLYELMRNAARQDVNSASHPPPPAIPSQPPPQPPWNYRR